MPTKPACICPAVNATPLCATKPETIPGWNPACPQHPVLWAGETAPEERITRLCHFDEKLSEQDVEDFRQRWQAAHRDGYTPPTVITYTTTHARRTRIGRILRNLLIGTLIALTVITAFEVIKAARTSNTPTTPPPVEHTYDNPLTSLDPETLTRTETP